MKRFLALVIIFALSVSLSSCGGSSELLNNKNTTEAVKVTDKNGQVITQNEQNGTIDNSGITGSVSFGETTQRIINGTTASVKNTSSSTYKGGSVTPEKTTTKNQQSTTAKYEGFTAVNPSNYRSYTMLNSEQKALYSKIKAAIANMDETINAGSCSERDLKLVYHAVNNDNPQLFWYPSSYQYEQTNQNRKVMFTYKYSKSVKDTMVAKLDKAVADALSMARSKPNQYTRELAVHDYLVSKITYDYDAVSAGHNKMPDAFNAYGALVNGKAVCEGYSRAFQLILYNLGIESTLITGKSKNQGHMWNMVKIDSKWYHVDATWNDTGDKGYHTYFNISDKMIWLDHQQSVSISNSAASIPADFNLSPPACNSMEQNYCTKNGTIINSEDQFNSVITNALKNNTIKSGTAIEFSYGENYNMTIQSSLSQKIMDVIVAYNKTVSGSKKITNSISVSGPSGSKGFIVKFV